MSLWLFVVEEHIVDHEIEARAQIRYIATEGVVWVNRYLEAIQVYTIVELKQLLNISVLISLHLFRREALPAEVLKGLIAHGIHRLRSMIKNDLPRLLVQLNILSFAIHLFLFSETN